MWAVEKIILQIPKRSFILFQADVLEVEAASYLSLRRSIHTNTYYWSPGDQHSKEDSTMKHCRLSYTTKNTCWHNTSLYLESGRSVHGRIRNSLISSLNQKCVNSSFQIWHCEIFSSLSHDILSDLLTRNYFLNFQWGAIKRVLCVREEVWLYSSAVHNCFWGR